MSQTPGRIGDNGIKEALIKSLAGRVWAILAMITRPGPQPPAGGAFSGFCKKTARGALSERAKMATLYKGR